MSVDNSQARVLVTGGAGYLGSVLVGRLLADGFSVRVLDNLTYGGNSILAYVSHERFDLAVGDTRKTEDVERALDGVQCVVHLAAIVGDPACARQPQIALDVNKKASESLAERAVARGVSRFVFASTCSNYGKMPVPDGYVTESSPLNPVSLYAELKVDFEKSLLLLRSERFAPTCLRFATAYGLSARPRFDLTVNEFTKELALGRKLDIYGEQFWRPYCHTSDIARAISLVLQSDLSVVSGDVFNVGDTSENYQKKTLAAMIVSELGDSAGQVNYVPREEDPRDYRVNFSKIHDVLGFRVKRRVIDGIREIIAAIDSGTVKEPDSPMYRNV
jgi:nucleoside-diphosphate-sugar epimerase